MDRKSIIILVAAISLLFLVSPVVDHYFPAKPAPARAPEPATNGPAAITNAQTQAPSPVSAVVPAPVQTMAAPSEPERTLTVSNQDLIFEFTSHGGGLKKVELRGYPAVIARTAQLAHGQPEKNFATLNGSAFVPVLALLGDVFRATIISS